jgi:hypothetical protein
MAHTKPEAFRAADPSVRLTAIKLLKRAVELILEGEPFPFLVANREVNPRKAPNQKIVHDLADTARKHIGGERTENQLLEAVKLLESGWSP